MSLGVDVAFVVSQRIKQTDIIDSRTVCWFLCERRTRSQERLENKKFEVKDEEVNNKRYLRERKIEIKDEGDKTNTKQENEENREVKDDTIKVLSSKRVI